jgi:hypothetical protein
MATAALVDAELEVHAQRRGTLSPPWERDEGSDVGARPELVM